MSFLAGLLAGVLAVIFAAAAGVLTFFSHRLAEIEIGDTVPVDWSES